MPEEEPSTEAYVVGLTDKARLQQLATQQRVEEAMQTFLRVVFEGEEYD